MRRYAFLSLLLLGLGVSASTCNLPAEISDANWDPKSAAIAQQLDGVWYASPIDGPYVKKPKIAYLRVISRNDTSLVNVIAWWSEYEQTYSMQLWLRGLAYPSQIDNDTYINFKRTAWVGSDYTAENVDSFLMLELRTVGRSAFFLHSLSSAVLQQLSAQGRIRVHAAVTGEGQAIYLVADVSRPELISLIHEIGPHKLFSEVTGPFYRLGHDPQELSPSARAVNRADGTVFGGWRVDCAASPAAITDVGHCVVQDQSGNVVLSLGAGDASGKVGIDRCKGWLWQATIDEETGSLERNDDNLSAELVEQMHFGRVLHLDYAACPSMERRRVDISLEGFAAALAAGTTASIAHLMAAPMLP
jgi:hypothetical protein